MHRNKAVLLILVMILVGSAIAAGSVGSKVQAQSDDPSDLSFEAEDQHPAKDQIRGSSKLNNKIDKAIEQANMLLTLGTDPRSQSDINSEAYLLDDFERADGELGPGWTVRAGECSITGGRATCGNYGLATINGAPGDGTALLWSLLDLGVTDAALAAIVDPTATAAAFDAGVGGAFRFPLGGRVDHRHGYPIDAAGTVRALNPARGSDRPDCETPGRTALLELEGRHGGSVAVIVCERPARWSSPESLRQHSIDPIKRHVVAVKSAADLRHGFARLATEILTVTTPGITTNDFSFFDFRHLRRPIFPLDEGDSTRPTSG